jgi:murein DD-endopeptidase MepM/ murein hydrolase activator NlpD
LLAHEIGAGAHQAIVEIVELIAGTGGAAGTLDRTIDTPGEFTVDEAAICLGFATVTGIEVAGVTRNANRAIGADATGFHIQIAARNAGIVFRAADSAWTATVRVGAATALDGGIDTSEKDIVDGAAKRLVFTEAAAGISLDTGSAAIALAARGIPTTARLAVDAAFTGHACDGSILARAADFGLQIAAGDTQMRFQIAGLAGVRAVGVGTAASVGNAGIGIGAAATTGRIAGATEVRRVAGARADILRRATVPILGAEGFATAVDTTADKSDRTALPSVFERADLMRRWLTAWPVIGRTAALLAKARSFAAGIVATFGIPRAPRQDVIVAARRTHAGIALRQSRGTVAHPLG